MLVIIQTHHIYSLQYALFTFYQSSEISPVHRCLFRMNMNDSKSFSINFCHTLGSIQPWRFKCVLLSLMNFLSHIQWKNFISLHYYNRRNPAFRSSLVKLCFLIQKLEPRWVYFHSHQRQKTNHCLLLLLAIQRQSNCDRNSWVGFWFMHQ